MANRLAIGTLLDHYRIVSKIGAGGRGEVYLAEDAKLGRNVALKLLPGDVSRERMLRFEQEARTAASLNHPNIAHIYEIGEKRTELQTPDAPIPVAQAARYSQIGERDRALAILEKAYEQRGPGGLRLNLKAFDSIRHDPRFQDLRRRIGLPE